MAAGKPAIAKPVLKAAPTMRVPIAAAPAAPTVLSNIESKLDTLLAKLKTDEASFATYAKKYWPIVVGLAIAATRFLHL
jgi:hypothetical protein